MKSKITTIFYMIFCLSIVSSAHASNILYTYNTNQSGPGVLLPAPVITEAEAKSTTIPIIASDSDIIYIHDGVKYMKGEAVGHFSLSGYCACKKCGSGTGITASGHPVRENHTIAADWSILPKGTMIILEDAVGKDGTVYDGVYEVEDKGGGIKNQRLDIYRPTHDLASLVTYYGRCYGDVYIAMPIDEGVSNG